MQQAERDREIARTPDQLMFLLAIHFCRFQVVASFNDATRIFRYSGETNQQNTRLLKGHAVSKTW